MRFHYEFKLKKNSLNFAILAFIFLVSCISEKNSPLKESSLCLEQYIESNYSTGEEATSIYYDYEKIKEEFDKTERETEGFAKEEGIRETSSEEAKEAPQESLPIPFPRTVLALWDSRYEGDISFTTTHRCAEMPLNFLGIKIEYIDLQKPLPLIDAREDLIGIISWLPELYKVKNPKILIKWLTKAMDSGKKLLIIGTYKFEEGENENIQNELWHRLGIYSENVWSSFTYNYEVDYQNPKFFPFEGAFPFPLPEFNTFGLSDSHLEVLLSLRSKLDANKKYPIVIIGEKGGFAPEEFLIYRAFYTEEIYKKWLINPFAFFRKVFNLPYMPIPDPSTIAGRRAYYSHIDGDGWNNETEILDTRGKEPVLSSEIILKQIVESSPDLPVTVGPIAANLNKDWNGSVKSQRIARSFLKIPQVEVGCHTYTHPFDWSFFKNYTENKEVPYLSRYQTKTWKQNPLGEIRRLFQKQETFYKREATPTAANIPKKFGKEEKPKNLGEQLEQHYFTPRAYAKEPFNLKLEIIGAIDEIDRFAPKDKEVMVYQWSGNTLPWSEALALTVKAQVRNINGGDPRFDYMHPSYAYVCALARPLGKEIQVYTCSSNENLYTDLWTKDFYGLVSLPTTFERTETPLRLKAMNLYYHMYSGEKLSSLHALLHNLAYIRTKKIAPITTSYYCQCVDGFYTSQIIPLSDREWLIQNRGKLQNFRLDQGTYFGVDFEKSKGIIGQRHFQGSLYIYLNETHRDPLIAIKEIERSDREPEEEKSYLIESRWKITNFNWLSSTDVTYQAQGYGQGEMRWKVPLEGIYEVKLSSSDGKLQESKKVESLKKELNWIFSESGINPVQISIFYRGLRDETTAQVYEKDPLPFLVESLKKTLQHGKSFSLLKVSPPQKLLTQESKTLKSHYELKISFEKFLDLYIVPIMGKIQQTCCQPLKDVSYILPPFKKITVEQVKYYE